jgi:hypothetical protein
VAAEAGVRLFSGADAAERGHHARVAVQAAEVGRVLGPEAAEVQPRGPEFVEGRRRPGVRRL